MKTPSNTATARRPEARAGRREASPATITPRASAKPVATRAISSEFASPVRAETGSVPPAVPARAR